MSPFLSKVLLTNVGLNIDLQHLNFILNYSFLKESKNYSKLNNPSRSLTPEVCTWQIQYCHCDLMSHSQQKWSVMMPKETCNWSLHNAFSTIYELHWAEVSNAEGNFKNLKLNHINFPLPLPGTDVTVTNSADPSQNSPHQWRSSHWLQLLLDQPQWLTDTPATSFTGEYLVGIFKISCSTDKKDTISTRGRVPYL